MFRAGLSACLRAGARNARPAVPASLHLARSVSAAASAPAVSATAGKTAAAVLAGSAVWLGLAQEGIAADQPMKERTFIAIKPDGVHRGLISEIIKRFESKGYKLVGIKLVVPSSELAGTHYAEHEGKPFYPKLVSFLTSGPVLAMVWEGDEVIKYGRTMIGATNPLASAPGTIRGDYAVNMGRNIIHGSDSVASAQREIVLWFRPEEIATWTPATAAWTYE